MYPDDKLHEECGVFGIYAPGREVARRTFFALYALQHRGQEAAGIVTCDGKMAHVHKGMGLVSQVFNEENLRYLQGHMAIGHTRYSTTGAPRMRNTQPYILETLDGPLAIGHNGNLINAPQLRRELLERGVGLQTSTDSELIIHLLAGAGGFDWATRIRILMARVEGAYGLVILTKDAIYGVRDPWGLRPLCLGSLEGGYTLASESCAFSTIGAKFICEIQPGEIVRIDEAGYEIIQGAPPQKLAFCTFEQIYFARPDSELGGRLVHQVRQKLGRQLAKEAPVDADIVIPVPDSGTPHAIGYALKSGIPYSEGLIKSRYIGRTFIEPTDQLRKVGVQMKFNPLPENLRGHRVVMVDDSIVRGNTSGPLVKLLRDAGAKEVHVRVACPPIRFPCFMGVDMASQSELIAANMSLDEICEHIGADSLAFLSLSGLMKALRATEGYCNACFTGVYPFSTPIPLIELQEKEKFPQVWGDSRRRDPQPQVRPRRHCRRKTVSQINLDPKFGAMMSDSVPTILRRHPLDAIFAPRNVAVIGATETHGSVGRTLLWNLISHPFGGAVYPVNPNRTSVLGIHTYKKIADVPAQVDLAVIVTPALSVPGLIEECVTAGVRGAIIISAGFKEIGKRGAQLEEKILARARSAQMRIIGPNCLGVMSPLTRLNATFAKGMALAGNVGFISQSGALCTSVLDWSFRENVGFSAFVSIGSMLDVDWGDLIYYLGDDEQTRSIVIYMESVGNAQSFLSAAREVSLSKPIIVIKAGRTAAAAKAAASHTGSLTGSDDVLDAAFRRSGVLRVDNLEDLFAMAEVLAKQPRPRGPRLTIVTNAGGPGVLATDTLVEDGGKLAELSAETMAAMDTFLPRHWSHNNPVDIIGDADPERYTKAVQTAIADPNTDGLLVILTPQDMTSPTETAQQVISVVASTRKPVLASWMGGPDVAAGVAALNRASIPTFDYPDTAAHIFNNMWRYAYNLRAIYETPSLPVASEAEATNQRRASELVENVRSKGRTILTEYEAKQIFAAYGIPTVDTRLAADADEAVHIADAIGYPVVLKLNSETITHKTDVNGVHLNLRDADTVRRAYAAIQTAVTERASADQFQGVTVQPMEKLDGYELIIGSSQDSQFGPVLLFGMGGTLVEVFRDRALALPPLNTTLARRMMEQTRIFEALQGVRGRRAVDIEALERLMVRFSNLVVEQPRIKEIDINPLLASSARIVALDARIVLHDPEVGDDELPRSAIRPYPIQYIHDWHLPDGTPIQIRPIKPEDEPLMTDFTLQLSPDNIYLRYFHAVSVSSLIQHEKLAQMCFVDYDREMALVAVREHPKSKRDEIIAHGQLTKLHGSRDAEFSIQVRDEVQGTGLGTETLMLLLQIARDEKLERVVAEIMPENAGMRRVCEKLGFTFTRIPDSPNVRAEFAV